MNALAPSSVVDRVVAELDPGLTPLPPRRLFSVPVPARRRVELRFTHETSPYSDYHENVEVLVDGVSVAAGTYGGCPEDNMRCRDYSWVEEAIALVAAALGAETVTTEQEGTTQ